MLLHTGHGNGMEPKRSRWHLSPADKIMLEKSFKKEPSPCSVTKSELAKLLKTTHRRVDIWFQNRRQKERRKKEDTRQPTDRQEVPVVYVESKHTPVSPRSPRSPSPQTGPSDAPVLPVQEVKTEPPLAPAPAPASPDTKFSPLNLPSVPDPACPDMLPRNFVMQNWNHIAATGLLGCSYLAPSCNFSSAASFPPPPLPAPISDPCGLGSDPDLDALSSPWSLLMPKKPRLSSAQRQLSDSLSSDSDMTVDGFSDDPDSHSPPPPGTAAEDVDVDSDCEFLEEKIIEEILRTEEFIVSMFDER